MYWNRGLVYLFENQFYINMYMYIQTFSFITGVKLESEKRFRSWEIISVGLNEHVNAVAYSF